VGSRGAPGALDVPSRAVSRSDQARTRARVLSFNSVQILCVLPRTPARARSAETMTGLASRRVRAVVFSGHIYPAVDPSGLVAGRSLPGGRSPHKVRPEHACVGRRSRASKQTTRGGKKHAISEADLQCAVTRQTRAFLLSFLGRAIDYRQG
jgi:hypothetical protein